jgi:hypothetical protein
MTDRREARRLAVLEIARYPANSVRWLWVLSALRLLRTAVVGLRDLSQGGLHR